MRNNNYPHWLLPYLSDGIYANKTINGFTLYRAHFVYDPIKKRSKKITDEIIGRVTEKDGLIPKKPYAKRIPIVYSFGIFKIIHDLTCHAFKTPSQNMIYYKTEIFVGAMLKFAYGRISERDFKSSLLYLLYPKSRINLMFGNLINDEINRGVLKIKDIINDFDISLFCNVLLLDMNSNFFVINLDDELIDIAKNKGVSLTYEKK